MAIRFFLGINICKEKTWPRNKLQHGGQEPGSKFQITHRCGIKSDTTGARSLLLHVQQFGGKKASRMLKEEGHKSHTSAVKALTAKCLGVADTDPSVSTILGDQAEPEVVPRAKPGGSFLRNTGMTRKRSPTSCGGSTRAKGLVLP